MRYVERARCLRDGEQAGVPVHVGHGRGAQADDIAKMAETRELELGGDGARKPRHRQAVGVEQVRAERGQLRLQELARLRLRQAPPL